MTPALYRPPEESRPRGLKGLQLHAPFARQQTLHEFLDRTGADFVGPLDERFFATTPLRSGRTMQLLPGGFIHIHMGGR